MRVYECERCGLRLDRDANAAINVLVRAFGDEARWGGATPRAGQHTPTTCGGGPETASVVSGATSMTNPLPAPLEVSVAGSGLRPTDRAVST